MVDSTPSRFSSIEASAPAIFSSVAALIWAT